MPLGVATPPAASTRISTAPSTPSSSISTPIVPRTWQPASMPWAIRKSHPAPAAARASLGRAHLPGHQRPAAVAQPHQLRVGVAVEELDHLRARSNRSDSFPGDEGNQEIQRRRAGRAPGRLVRLPNASASAARSKSLAPTMPRAPAEARMPETSTSLTRTGRSRPSDSSGSVRQAACHSAAVYEESR
jgi:hypothetical protein